MAIWNGRFRGKLHPDALKFSSSLEVDKRLYREDIEGSIAHVIMLAKQRIISRKEARRIEDALRQIQREIAKDRLPLDRRLDREGRFVAEDIHMAIEKRLIEK